MASSLALRAVDRTRTRATGSVDGLVLSWPSPAVTFSGRYLLRRRLRYEDLVEPDALVRPLGMGGEPFEGLAGLLEEVRILLLHGTALHHAVVVASRFHESDVLLRRDAPVHDQGGLFRSGEDGKTGEGLETVERLGEGLGLRLVAGADPGGDGEAPLVHDQREADEGAVGALLLGVAPPGQGVPLRRPFQIEVREVVEEDEGIGRKQGPGVLDQGGLEDLLLLEKAVGDRVEGVGPDIEVFRGSENLAQGGRLPHPLVGGPLAPRSHEAADRQGTGQGLLPGGEAFPGEDGGDPQLLPGVDGQDLRTQGAVLLRLERVGVEGGPAGGPGNRSLRLLAGGEIPPHGRLDDGHEFRIGSEDQSRDRRLRGRSPFEPLPEKGFELLDAAGLEIEPAQRKENAGPGTLLRLKGFDELVRVVDLAVLLFVLAGADKHCPSGRSVRGRHARTKETAQES
jgi:hypothetical protein